MANLEVEESKISTISTKSDHEWRGKLLFEGIRAAGLAVVISGIYSFGIDKMITGPVSNMLSSFLPAGNMTSGLTTGLLIGGVVFIYMAYLDVKVMEHVASKIGGKISRIVEGGR
jgi:hypothetical protein